MKRKTTASSQVSPVVNKCIDASGSTNHVFYGLPQELIRLIFRYHIDSIIDYHILINATQVNKLLHKMIMGVSRTDKIFIETLTRIRNSLHERISYTLSGRDLENIFSFNTRITIEIICTGLLLKLSLNDLKSMYGIPRGYHKTLVLGCLNDIWPQSDVTHTDSYFFIIMEIVAKILKGSYEWNLHFFDNEQYRPISVLPESSKTKTLLLSSKIAFIVSRK